MRIVSPPRVWISSWWTISTTCCAGFSASLSSTPTHRSRMRATRSADDLEVDVRLEQRQADLPQDLVDVVLAEPAAPAQALEDAVEAVRQ